MSTMSKVTCYFADGKRALAIEAIQWVVRRLEQAVADAHAVEGMEENDVCLAAIVD
jgi:alcohol dehydrogenase class IV